MIPRKKIQFIIGTLCILYAFGNRGCVSAGQIEIRTEDPPELIDNTISRNDNATLNSTVITDAYSQSNTTVEYTTVTEESEETSSAYSTIIQSNGTTTELPSCRDTLSSVQNLTVSITNSTILVTWESVTTDDGCVIEYNITWYSDSNYRDSDTVNSTESKFTISDLTPCTYYTIDVVAVGASGVSKAQTITCNTTELPPGAVSNLTVPADQITWYSVFLTWSAPTLNQNCVQFYNVTTCDDNNCTEASTNELFYNATSLDPCLTYSFAVTAVGVAGSSDAESTTANTSYVAPGAVNDLTAPSDSITGYSVYLTWSAPTLNPKCIQFYNVTTCYDNDCTKAYTNELFYNVTSLDPCLTYSFAVGAVGDAGSSDAESTTANTSYVAPGAVNDLTAPADSITGYSIYLTWSAPTLNPKCVQFYNVTTCHDNDCTDAYTNELFYNVTSLDPCLTYSFAVRAVGDAGSSDAQSMAATTSYIVPGLPASIVAIPGQFSLFLYWEPPEIGGTCTSSYRLTVWATGSTQTTPNTNATISDLPACTNHTVQIIPIDINGGEGQLGTVSNITEESVSDPPILEVEEPVVTKNTISIVWFIDRTMNQCELETLLTICNFTSTEGSGFEGVDQQSEYTISGSDSSANVTMNVTVNNLSPFSSYNCTGAVQNVAGYSESSTAVTATTEEDVPSAPTLSVSSSQSSTFTLEWDKPEYLAGNLIQHEILLSWERLSLRPSSCIHEDLTTEEAISDINGSATEHTHSGASAYSQYTASIRARTNAGWGNYSSNITFNTSADVPGAVSSIKYLNTTNSDDSNLLDTYLFWKLPCSLNGEIESFYIHFKGERDGFDPDIYNQVFDDVANISSDKIFTKNFGELKAEYNYTFEISAKVFGVSVWGPSNSYNVIYPAGIPPFPEQWYMDALKLDMYKMRRTSSTATILLPLFNNTNGVIMYYAVMISEIGQNKYSESRLDILSGDWPNVTSWKAAMSHMPIILYQATPIRWHPNITDEIFNPGHLEAVKFVLGSNDSCSELSATTYCNGPLRPDTQYQVRMRAFTNGGFRDSPALLIKTKAEFNLGMVIGVVFGILFFGIITTMMLLVRKGVLQTALSNILHPSVQSSPGPDPFTRKKFELHCQELIDNPRRLGNEFQMLQTLSVDLEMSSNAAELQANRRKNRYINILPYDISRVKLDIVNNDPNSDYINASLIPGYSGGIEYIACQGPKEETTYDFWRMIYQYNVKVIVMVTQLVEKGKDKCYQYYPNTRENFEYEDIVTRCSSQLDFVFYTRRNITLEKKGGIKRTVTHLHFKEWSDHGVPDDIHSMINFCQIVRKLIIENKGLAVVHCSAGVGRTGTLIAIDILLQQIKDNKKLDVFGTVYKMRQHRMNMVQTESQYAYIYNCTKQALNNPPKHYKTSSVEPVYENLAKKRRDIVDSNTNLVNSAETLKKMSLSPSGNSANPVCEINVPQRPIYASQLSTLSLRYSKSSSAINSQITSNLEIARYGSHEYPIFEPAPDSPLSKVSMDMNGFLDFARPIKIETRISRPESINLGETIDQSMDGVIPNY